MFRSKKMQKKRLRMEPLEKRMMLAGNVLASVVNGDLIITGDTENNDIAICSAEDGGYRIMGIDRYVDGVKSRTRLNGQDGPVIFEDVPGNVVVDLGEGDDLLRIEGAVDADLSINAGSGCDDLRVRHDVAGDLSIAAGAGNDTVTVLGDVHGDVLINTEAGDDQIGIWSNVIEGDLQVDMGSGDDKFNQMSYGDDTMPVLAPPFAPTNAYVEAAEPGEDDFEDFPSWTVSGNVTILVGEGQDYVAARNASVGGDLTVGAAEGDDELVMRGSSVGGSLSVNLGGGDDSLTLEETTVLSDAVLDGGAGTDLLNQDYLEVNTAAGWSVFNFENVPSASTSNITAEVVDGNLVITGDDGDNQLRIFRTDDGGYCLQGQDLLMLNAATLAPLGPVTLINGEMSAVTFHGVTGSIIISLGGGDDSVVVGPWFFSLSVIDTTAPWDMEYHDIGFFTGAGLHSLVNTIDAPLVLDTGSGNDTVSFSGVMMRDNVSVNTGDGDDDVRLSNGPLLAGPAYCASPAHYLADLTVTTGAGNDLVSTTCARIKGDLVVATGSGDDKITVGYKTCVNQYIHPYDEVHVAAYHPATVGGRIDLATGAGADSVTVTALNAESDLAITLDADDDALSIQNAEIAGAATLDGGFGTDLLNEDYLELNTAAQWSVSGFEDVDLYFSGDDPPNEPAPSPVEGFVGPLPLPSTVETRKLLVPSPRCEMPGVQEGPSPVASPAEAAHDEAIMAWDALVSRRQDTNKDRDETASPVLFMTLDR